MRDGVRLAADVILPAPVEPGARLRSRLHRTRYWRDVELCDPQRSADPVLLHFTALGYAVMRVEVRGTGASFGNVLHEWQAQDIADAYELVEWITAQPWCSGQVGTDGGSWEKKRGLELTL